MHPIASLLLQVAPLPVPQVTITNGTTSVDVNAYGVLVGAPSSGFRTVDGPIVGLHPGFAEWFGIGFDTGHGRIEAVGLGSAPDWGNRTPLRCVELLSAPDTVTATTRVGDLEVRSAWGFEGAYLIVTTTFENLGSFPLRNLLYSREWRTPGESSGWVFPTDLPGAPPAPHDVSRILWMPDDLQPGATQSVTFSYVEEGAIPQPQTTLVPLAAFTSPAFPAGLVFGETNGISWGDYDADGWIDVFCTQSARLWRNLSGTGWQLVADLDQAPTAVLPPGALRYGASFGDYDADGLPDLPTEPRSGGTPPGNCFQFLHNLGGGPNFADVSNTPPVVISQPCAIDSETIGWVDVDGDADLDLFLPVYPPTGNFFWTNLGPVGAGGAYNFAETSAASGFDNPPGNARPEGAQFADADQDGDPDLYSNGALYQNKSSPGAIDFDALSAGASGIGFNTLIDEGAMLFDYDRDGDVDVVAAYISSPGVVIWENRGDTTFFQAEAPIVVNPLIGLGLGMSAEDWDNDGDIDFTTRNVFRRNMIVETGTRQFLVAPTSIPASFLTSATPAWGDWDRDGDLDCALGNWLEQGRLYQNTTYGAATAPGNRRYVRVRPLRDSAAVPAGLETEFAATVEIRVSGDPAGVRRRKFTASGSGYLNQNEYALHFALPPDPFPALPNQDVRFDVVVDFPNPAGAGVHRVDRFVNPVLGNLNLADLVDREIDVFRSGRVRINGCEIVPVPPASPTLTTTTNGLALPTATVAPPLPAVSPTPDRFVGLDFDTLAATAPFRVKELLIDGQLDAPVACGAESFNVVLWDVTVPGAPFRRASASLATSTRNRRTFFPVSWVLEPLRHYRLLARVTQRRAKTIAGPVAQGPVTVLGGLDFADADPCSGVGAEGATVDATKAWVAFRFAPDLGTEWVDLGGGLAGAGGIPILAATGSVSPGEAFTLTLEGAAVTAPSVLVAGFSSGCVPIFGGASIPAIDSLLLGLRTDELGALVQDLSWPPGWPVDLSLLLQIWVVDPTAPQGVAASNTIAGTLQP
jgi:VCBS repeat protein